MLLAMEIYCYGGKGVSPTAVFRLNHQSLINQKNLPE